MDAHAQHDPSPLQAGRSALARGEWEAALAHLERGVAARPQDAPAWEALGAACTWLQQTDRAIDARERAYERYRELGDDVASARVALDLANDYFEMRGEAAIANGWIQRARRLLIGLPPNREHAMLRIWDAYLALFGEADAVAAEGHAQEAVAIAERTGAGDAAVLALALQGVARVSQGRADAGMPLLDEAVAGALGRDISDPQWFYLACCCMIDACDRVRDFQRSIQWCDRLREFCSRWRVQSFLTTCRIKYTGALLWRGEWQRCESELEKAIAELQLTGPHGLPAAYVRLAELRRRQGRRREAGELLERAGAHPLAIGVHAALALDDGDALAALERAEAWLRRTPAGTSTERVAALELKTRAHVERGELDDAAEAGAELSAIAATVGTAALQATSLVAAGLLARAAGRYEDGARASDDAAYGFETAGSEYEAARARLEQARCLTALERTAAAAKLAGDALATFERIGALPDAKRARELVERLHKRAGLRRSTGRGAGAGTLTRRQREVLALVAQGMSDREVAEKLFLSEHTVHRHIANILGRLGVTSRAAAVARALRGEQL
jgi:LuxR family transcriptional regulator, maltose regulon positive regulatory protein